MFVLGPDEYQRMTAAAAGGLRARGLSPGDRVAIITPEHRFPADQAATLQASVIAIVAAALRTGLVPVPINPMLTAAESAHIVNDSGATTVVSEAGDLVALTEHTGSDPGAVRVAGRQADALHIRDHRSAQGRLHPRHRRASGAGPLAR